MQYAIVEISGKQYKVEKGATIEVDRLNTPIEKGLILDRVLLHVDGEKVQVGKPYLENVTVIAKIAENIKGEKIDVFKFRSKSRRRLKRGFRPFLSKVIIEDIKEKSVKK